MVGRKRHIEPVLGRLKTELKPVLLELLARGTDTPLSLSAQLLAARLGLAQVDPAEVRARFTSTSQAETTRLQALDALIISLGSPDHPALIVLDDCQWADELTLKLLARWNSDRQSTRHGHV